MDGRDLSQQHYDLLYRRLRDSFEYLAKLQARMEARGWHQGDRLYLEVVIARKAMQLLCDDLHSRAYRNWRNSSSKRGE